MKQVLMVTALPVWSLGKGKGAPSFYNTLKMFDEANISVEFFTTERKPAIEELQNIYVKHIVKLKNINIPVINFLWRNTRYILNQIIFLFIFIAIKNKNFDILYAYEIEFTPALKFISVLYKIPMVSRFQGTILHPLMKKPFWRLRYLPHYMSIKINSSLTIMTDDGTLGDKVVEQIRGHKERLSFLRNGVDRYSSNKDNVSDEIVDLLERNQKLKIFFSVSRITTWKRLDRSIEIFSKIHGTYTNCIYLIGGDGIKRKEWELYAQTNSSGSYITFLGDLNKDEVAYINNQAQFFISSYELSNMGNPLFEAMEKSNIVITLSNGSTGDLIQDGYNGIISKEEDYINNSTKVLNLIEDEATIALISTKSRETYQENFVSWEERLAVELKILAEIKI
jgi:glycosyltransferase involved in cell wall biosynthesis